MRRGRILLVSCAGALLAGCHMHIFHGLAPDCHAPQEYQHAQQVAPLRVPAGLDSAGLPLGMHLIGRPLDEQGVLNAGLAMERRAAFSARPAKWW